MERTPHGVAAGVPWDPRALTFATLNTRNFTLATGKRDPTCWPKASMHTYIMIAESRRRRNGHAPGPAIIFLVLVLVAVGRLTGTVRGFRVADDNESTEPFVPYEKGFVGRQGTYKNTLRVVSLELLDMGHPRESMKRSVK